MKRIKSLFWFCGSLYFALILLILSALFVIVGTFLESKTSSHLYAAYYIYSHPIFNGILLGFFFNILISTCRRWPFQFKHIPFIITHIGLLMVLSGVLFKSYYGLQGSMTVVEGSAQDEMVVNWHWALSLESKNEKTLIPLDISNRQNPIKNEVFRDLKVEILGFYPHAKEIVETWIKGDALVISGLPPIKCQKFEDSNANLLRNALRARLFPPPSAPWNIIALKAENPYKAFKSVYSDTLSLRLRDSQSDKIISEQNLKVSLSNPIETSIGQVTINLSIPLSSNHDFNPQIELLLITPAKSLPEKIRLPLNGPQSLQNLNYSPPYLGDPFIEAELVGSPTLLFIENESKDMYLFAFDGNGRVHLEIFKNENLNRYVIYDSGFGGYSLWADLPFSIDSSTPSINDKKLLLMKADLEKASQNSNRLCLPLQLMKDACEKKQLNFINCCLDFLSHWNKSKTLLLPDYFLPSNLERCLEVIDGSSVPIGIKNGCYWTAFILDELERQLSHEPDLLICLNNMKWPLVNELKYDTTLESEAEQHLKLLNDFVRQIFSAADFLPFPLSLKEASNGKLLSGLFLLHGLHLSYINSPAFEEPPSIKIECPISFKFKPLIPEVKLEDNTPLLRLCFKENGQQEEVCLGFDRGLNGFKQSLLKGNYLVRFQPYFEKIPYRLRLRQARQINYPDSQQPYSYESDVIIVDKKNGVEFETTLSMNQVHETWEGYRFYLANMTPSDPGAVKRIHIIVNLDPAKYWLTYPGGVIMILGIIFLFWYKPYSKAPKK